MLLGIDDPVPVSAGMVLAGKYRVERLLGKGGFGVVVAATHLALGQQVAIKILLADATWTGDAVLRFQREAQAASRLKGEHAARILDFGTLENQSPYMVMELLQGQDLAQIIRDRSPIPVPLAIEFVLQACEALAEAHALGIVHRDVKPANLFLTARHDGTPCVKVVDFGMSKSTTDLQGNLTKTSAVLGTPYYMSPEQMRSSKTVTPRADIWSLGVVLHELLAGRVPYNGDTLGELCSKVFMNPPDSLRAARPEVPQGLEQVVLKCLQKNEAERYPTVAQLAVDLAPFAPAHAQVHVDRIVRTLGFGDRSSLVGSSGMAATPSMAPPALGQSQSIEQRASGLRLVAGAGVFLALALALALGVYFGRGAPREDASRPADSAATSAPPPPAAASSASPSPSATQATPAPAAPASDDPAAKRGPAPKRPDDAPKPAPAKKPDDGFGDFHVRH